MTVGISNFGVEDKQLLPIIELFQEINVVCVKESHIG